MLVKFLKSIIMGLGYAEYSLDKPTKDMPGKTRTQSRKVKELSELHCYPFWVDGDRRAYYVIDQPGANSEYENYLADIYLQNVLAIELPKKTATTFDEFLVYRHPGHHLVSIVVEY